MTEPTGTAERYKELHDGGMSYRDIGAKFNVSRQSVQNMIRRNYGPPGRRVVTKRKGDVHTAEVRVHDDVYVAAMARLDAIANQRGLIGSSRITMSALCREIMAMPLTQAEFPKLPFPFASSPPGSHSGTMRIVRWQTLWGKFDGRQKAIHRRGYSVSQVIEKRLRAFAFDGLLPWERGKKGTK